MSTIRLWNATTGKELNTLRGHEREIQSAIALAKQAVNAADSTVEAGLIGEAHLFNLSLATPEAQARMTRFMEIGGQTPEVEKGIGTALEQLLKA